MTATTEHTQAVPGGAAEAAPDAAEAAPAAEQARDAVMSAVETGAAPANALAVPVSATAGGAPLGLGEHTHGGSAPATSRGERPASFDVDDFPVPGGREEEWRFTPLDRLAGLLAGEPSAAVLELAPDLPDGVTLAELAGDDPLLRELPRPADRLAALAHALTPATLHVQVPRLAEPTAPVHLGLSGTTPGQVVYGHTVVDIGDQAVVTVVLDHRGSAAYDGAVSIRVGNAAHVTVVTVQDWDDGAVHTGQHDVVVGRDATVRHVAVSFGGDVRLTTNVTYAGPGGHAELLGVYFADAGQHLEHRLFVDHSVPRCTSDVTYRGALQGAGAHAVWVGDVLIRAAAEGTNTYEQNRNLVLTEGARVDSIPNLEIETGEIEGAGHASTTGRFDDEQLFYLQARGIPEAQARRLVVFGFFTELINRIGVPGLQERLVGAVERELSAAVA